MSDEEHLEWAKGVARLLRGIYEDQIIAASETMLGQTPPYREIPDPMTAHPAFTHAMDFVRSFNKNLVRVAMAKHMNTYVKDEGAKYPTAVEPTSTTILRKTKVWGAAPYVGDPRVNEACYVWPVWVDDYGRYISGDSELVWRY